MNKLTLGYVRVSTDRQDISIDAQTDRVKQAAAYHCAGQPFSLFAEPDTSGRIEFARRPEAAELLERAREARAAGVEVTVIVPKVDRLGRDAIDVNQTVRLFDQMGVRLIFLDINDDTRTAIGRAFLQIAAIFAELEVATIRERIKTALDQKRSADQLTGTVTFGWDAVDSGQTNAAGKTIFNLRDHPEEQKWIRHMAARRAEGWNDHAIARELNRLGVKTKRAGQTIKVPCDPDTPGAFLFHDRWVIEKPASGKWQAQQVGKLLASRTVQDWLASQS
jgi:DNA invertase Pin-like site-specific DNA recombinase